MSLSASRSKPILIGAAALAVASGLGGYVWHEEQRPKSLEVYVFDLKSGWSAFVRTPDDKRILINGGANSAIIRNLTTVLPFYSRRIDTVIVTDAEGKDSSGLVDVLDRYDVGRVIVPAMTPQSLGLSSSTDQIYQVFLDTVARLKIPVQEVSAGDSITLSKESDPPVRADILFPAASSSFAYSRASGPEIVLRISYADTSAFLLGNVCTKIQKYMAKSVARTDVLIVPHSASPDSLSSDLMDSLKPEYLVYSKAVTKAPSKSKTASKYSAAKNKKPDPLYFILNDKRFNIKEKGRTIKIVSDGKEIHI